MQLLEVGLPSDRLEAQAAFYAEVLGLPVQSTADGVSVQVGATLLTFGPGGAGGPFHLAFDVPEHRFEEAEQWLRRRVPLLAERGQDSFFSENWNARMVYFRDADGNILELIARHTLPRPEANGAALLLNVSEVGVAVPDVPQAVRRLRDTLGLQTYSAHSDSFAPVGTPDGLLIVVAQGRPWFPTVQVAHPLPLRVLAHTPLSGQVVLGAVQITGVTHP